MIICDEGCLTLYKTLACASPSSGRPCARVVETWKKLWSFLCSTSSPLKQLSQSDMAAVKSEPQFLQMYIESPTRIAMMGHLIWIIQSNEDQGKHTFGALGAMF